MQCAPWPGHRHDRDSGGRERVDRGTAAGRSDGQKIHQVGNAGVVSDEDHGGDLIIEVSQSDDQSLGARAVQFGLRLDTNWPAR